MRNENITIENAILQELDGDNQTVTLDFMSFLHSHKMEFIRGDGYWAGQYYWCVRYMNEDMCYILVNGIDEEKESGPFTIWSETSDTSNLAWYEAYPLDEQTKQIAWSNVDICGKCSPNAPCYGGLHKKIFGKDFDHVCRCTFRFNKPDKRTFEYIKKLIEIRKCDINERKDSKNEY